MSPIFLAFLVLLVIAQLALPKRFACVPLVIAGLHIGNIEILPEFTTARLLIAIGLARAIATGSFQFSFSSRLDVAAIGIAAAALLSSVGHSPDEWTRSPFIARAGWVFNIFGTYLYGRAFLPDLDSLRRYAHILCLGIAPLGLGLAYEKAAHSNLYYPLGGVTSGVLMREGKARAMGPFRHPILAGTAGATALPFALFLWRERRRAIAGVGLLGCILTVLSSSSSGPISAALFAIGLYFFWYKRHLVRRCIWAMIVVAVVYTSVSGRGPWYLMLKIDFTGGSTGWHRAYLIDQAWGHLGEWWLWGTSQTRHWMPTGVTWNPNHADMTNYFIHIGVLGGLPTLGAFVLLLYRCIRRSFYFMGQCRIGGNSVNEFVLWTITSSLLTHILSCLSISYFDQMYIFVFILLGASASVYKSEPALAESPALNVSYPNDAAMTKQH